MSRFKEWYANNKEAFNEQRKNRRAKDKRYQARVKEENAESRQRRREKQHAEKREEAQHREVHAKLLYRYELVKRTQCVTIGALALATGLSIQVLRRREGVAGSGVPLPHAYTENGERLYSLRQIEEATDRFASERRARLEQRPEGRLAWVRRAGAKHCVRVWLVSEAARCVGKSVRAYLLSEQRGAYPPTPLRTLARSGQLHRRLYTAEQLKILWESTRRYPESCSPNEARVRWIQRVWEAKGYGSDVKFIAYAQQDTPD